MSTQATVEQKIIQKLHPLHVEVVNESHMHNVPEGAESHFKVTVVSDRFEGQGLVARHRIINEVLAQELKDSIHALALHTMTPDEWFEAGGTAPDSPLCRGGATGEH